METIFINEHNLADYQKQAASKIMALGFFDGLHAGHRKVISEARKLAVKRRQLLAVMSFTPHPKVVLTNGHVKVPRLMTLAEKQKQLELLGVDIFYLVEFTKTFAALSPKRFVKNYLLDLKVHHVVAGFDFTYGHRGSGNLERMVQDAEGRLDVTKVKKVQFAGEKISSTNIRKRIADGEVDIIPYLLGHHFETVGRWDGRELIPAEDCLVPGEGTYIAVFKQGKRTLQAEVMVKEGLILCPYGVPQSFTGEVRLEWVKQAYTENFIQVK